MVRLYTLLIFFYIYSISSATCQKRFKQENKEDGISLNPAIGIGSVVGELGDILYFKPIYGILADKGISEKVNLGISVVGGNLESIEDDSYSSKFKTDYFQVQALGLLNISRYFITSYKKNIFELKFYGGVGMIWFHTNVYDLKTGIFLRATSEDASKHTTLFQSTGAGIGEAGIYYTRELVIPVGFKLDYKINNELALNVDMGYNWVNNDKLDGTTSYNILKRNIIAGVNSYSDTLNDGWVILSIGLKYSFSSKISFIPRGV